MSYYGVTIFKILDFNEPSSSQHSSVFIQWATSRAANYLNISVYRQHTLLSATLSYNLQLVGMLLVGVS